MGRTFDRIGEVARRQLERFSAQFTAGIMAADPNMWGHQAGLFDATDAVKTSYPIPVSASEFVKEEGNDRLRRLFSRSLSVIPDGYVDGVAQREVGGPFRPFGPDHAALERNRDAVGDRDGHFSDS